jgi:succinate-semialdehyde dehydrogenase/glutarate-semialdehyde dehydrogenase
MVDAAAVAKVRRHITDAVNLGATVLTGGGPASSGSLFIAPTVLKGVTRDMLVAREETFGPLAPLFSFDTEAQVVEMANDTEFGLAGYFFTRDLDRAWRVAEALEYGMVGINTGLISTEIAPFGGIKQSGIGREGSIYGLHDFTEMKYLSFGIKTNAA